MSANNTPDMACCPRSTSKCRVARCSAWQASTAPARLRCCAACSIFVHWIAGRSTFFGASHLLPASRQALAFLPEQFMPVPHLTGDEFLQYVVKLLGQRYNRAEAAHMLQTLDLEESALKRTVRLYSKGMTQKLGLAATFLIRKELYVLDEPTSGLDPRARVRLKERLLALRGEGATVLLTSHALADIDELCDQMAILHGGRLAFAGSPAACRAHFGTDSLEAAFMTATSQCTSPISA